MKNILFICTANRYRSRTAFDYFSKKLEGKYNVDSCGTSTFYVEDTKKYHWAQAKIFTKELHDWADHIFVMEEIHITDMMKLIGHNSIDISKVSLLEIDDVYLFNDATLIEILDKKVSEYLDAEEPLKVSTPPQISTILTKIPLRVKIRAILKQNDLANWVEGQYRGDTNQLENTVRALEWMIEEHIKALNTPTIVEP